MTPVADAWRRQAGRDLAHARKSFEMEDFEWACNAAQQSVEKLFKAVLIEAGHTPPRTHDLVGLARVLEQVGLLTAEERQDLGALNELSDFAVTARYPMGDALTAPGEMFDADRATRALTVAEAAWSKFGGAS
ncbi:HEPN domain-containing protein [Caenispirillum salinarum]|uniref:HEPN domain-containing protein n=1 Tax=Caenispirillum salinarum TaxID=859058 RepID=UPI00384C0F24